jgi:hypothetical protein
MATILSILDFVVVLLVVMNVSLAIWKEPSGSSSSLVLSVCVTAAVAIFGLVSLTAASGLTTSSAFDQGSLAIFLVATAVATRMWRAKKPVQ